MPHTNKITLNRIVFLKTSKKNADLVISIWRTTAPQRFSSAKRTNQFLFSRVTTAGINENLKRLVLCLTEGESSNSGNRKWPGWFIIILCVVSSYVTCNVWWSLQPQVWKGLVLSLTLSAKAALKLRPSTADGPDTRSTTGGDQSRAGSQDPCVGGLEQTFD